MLLKAKTEKKDYKDTVQGYSSRKAVVLGITLNFKFFFFCKLSERMSQKHQSIAIVDFQMYSTESRKKKCIKQCPNITKKPN